MSCKHYLAVSETRSYCGINVYGKNVQIGEKVCRHCPQYDGPVRGLGDAIHNVVMPIVKFIGSDCIDQTTQHLKADSPCQKKREALNR